MTRQILIGLAGTLAIALGANATPIESYGFDAPTAADSSDTLRTLSFAGAKRPGAAPTSSLGKGSTPATSLGSVTPGERMRTVLVTEAMTPPAATSTAVPPGDPAVVIEEPHMALLMLAGLLALARRRR